MEQGLSRRAGCSDRRTARRHDHHGRRVRSVRQIGNADRGDPGSSHCGTWSLFSCAQRQDAAISLDHRQHHGTEIWPSRNIRRQWCHVARLYPSLPTPSPGMARTFARKAQLLDRGRLIPVERRTLRWREVDSNHRSPSRDCRRSERFAQRS
jgi:hypothetical protein